MGQILADQPPGSGPSAVRALTCDALDAPLLADVAVTERDEPAPRRHLDTEEPAAAARARLGSAGGPRPRTRRRDSPPSLRLVDAAFHWVVFPWQLASLTLLLGSLFLFSLGLGSMTATGFFQPDFQRLLETVALDVLVLVTLGSLSDASCRCFCHFNARSARLSGPRV
jgi:hypothetical protein